jgi:glutamine synthetase
VNSYKRYVDASWAPTRLAWSHDNRTAGFRVVGHGPTLRIECRIPGADCNPYLALAAALASGLDGVRQRTEPPACFRGDAYAARDLPRVPGALGEATERFAAGDFPRRAFGPDVVAHYAHFFRTEQAAFATAVTDWERRRYFERI